MEPLSFSQLIARKQRAEAEPEKTQGRPAIKVSAIDDDIARLESELNGSDGSISESTSESSDVEDERLQQEPVADGVVAIRGKSGELMVLKSAIDAERIQHLPKHLLPLPSCSKADSKGAVVASKTSKVSFSLSNSISLNKSTNNSETATRKRMRMESGHQENNSTFKTSHQQPSGLSKTVKDLIRNYIPSSLEKKAFWCRACQFQASSEEEFFHHRDTESHAAASEMERKASYCKLCRKQFTSPEQIKEHLKGKAHREKMESTSRNQNRKTSAGGVKYDRI